MEIIREIHEGDCGSHQASETLARKILLQGYYHPKAFSTAKDYVQRCDKCQRFSSIQRAPPVEMCPITAPWPFAWGLDILGPFKGSKGRKFLLVAIDYFTRWIEARAMAKITSPDVRKFLWIHIFSRFGMPNRLIMDHGPQFDSEYLRGYLQEMKIKFGFSSVLTPRSNGAVERANRTLLNGLKTRLDKAKGRWADELHSVLWAYRTTPRETTGETPFKLAYGTEAMVPVELKVPSPRVANFREETNDEALRINLDLLEEQREKATIRTAAQQQRAAKYYNKKVKSKLFKEGDLVLRAVEASDHKLKQDLGKLAPNWEGPYRVRNIVKPGTYELETLDGVVFPRLWNSSNLRKYYQ